MISLQAQQSLDSIFTGAASRSLVVNTGDFCQVEKLSGNMEFAEKDIFILTISSLLFKVLTIFHVGDDQETRNYFLNANTDKSFPDVFSEIGNMCSGAMNQELLRYFSHLGMSTPYLLTGKCLPYLKDLKPGYTSRHSITINGTINLHATLCLCNYAPIDFKADSQSMVNSSGELEMF